MRARCLASPLFRRFVQVVTLPRRRMFVLLWPPSAPPPTLGHEGYPRSTTKATFMWTRTRSHYPFNARTLGSCEESLQCGLARVVIGVHDRVVPVVVPVVCDWLVQNRGHGWHLVDRLNPDRNAEVVPDTDMGVA